MSECVAVGCLTGVGQSDVGQPVNVDGPAGPEVSKQLTTHNAIYLAN